MNTRLMQFELYGVIGMSTAMYLFGVSYFVFSLPLNLLALIVHTILLLAGVGLASAWYLGTRYLQDGAWPGRDSVKAWAGLFVGLVAAFFSVALGWPFFFPPLVAIPTAMVATHWIVVGFVGFGEDPEAGKAEEAE